MKLLSISLRNIKCFENNDFDFKIQDTDTPLSTCVLLGANGSGKSTILQSIVSTFALLDSSYGGETFNENVITLNNDNATIDINFILNDYETSGLLPSDYINTLSSAYSKEKYFDEDGDEHEQFAHLILPTQLQNDFYKISISNQDNMNLFMQCIVGENDEDDFNNLKGVLSEQQIKYLETQKDYATTQDILRTKNKCLVIYLDSVRYLTTLNSLLPDFNTAIDTPKRCSLSSSIKKNILPTYDGIHERLSRRYNNLKSWLFNLEFKKLKKINSYDEIIYNYFVKACNKFFAPIKFHDISVDGKILFKNVQTSDVLNLDMLSDGFKSIFMIITELICRLSLSYDIQYGREYDIEFYELEAVVLIDEIDCHIHPRWQVHILPYLRELFPNCQFIVTTHSPYILNSVQPYEIKKIGDLPFN